MVSFKYSRMMLELEVGDRGTAEKLLLYDFLEMRQVARDQLDEIISFAGEHDAQRHLLHARHQIAELLHAGGGVILETNADNGAAGKTGALRVDEADNGAQCAGFAQPTEAARNKARRNASCFRQFRLRGGGIALNGLQKAPIRFVNGSQFTFHANFRKSCTMHA